MKYQTVGHKKDNSIWGTVIVVLVIFIVLLVVNYQVAGGTSEYNCHGLVSIGQTQEAKDLGCKGIK